MSPQRFALWPVVSVRDARSTPVSGCNWSIELVLNETARHSPQCPSLAPAHRYHHEHLFAAKPRNVYDVTGAGDMVLAMVGLCQAAEVALPETIGLANVAAGLEVEQLGVAVISRKRIHGELVSRQLSPCQKLVSSEEMATIADASRRDGKSLVFTNGCFDLLHPGHVAFLQEASSLGDVLLVAVNSDHSVAALKGDDRPIVGEMDRLGMLASLHCVNHVLLLDEPTPCRLLRNFRPDVIVKGGTAEEIVGREIVESYGGNAYRLSSYGGYSTTTIISKILKTQELVVPAEAHP